MVTVKNNYQEKHFDINIQLCFRMSTRRAVMTAVTLNGAFNCFLENHPILWTARDSYGYGAVTLA